MLPCAPAGLSYAHGCGQRELKTEALGNLDLNHSNQGTPIAFHPCSIKIIQRANAK